MPGKRKSSPPGLMCPAWCR